jgi:hypothetical protein
LDLFKHLFRGAISEATAGFAQGQLEHWFKLASPAERELLKRELSAASAAVAAHDDRAAAEALGKIIGSIKF